jgi:hypothetical protein
MEVVEEIVAEGTPPSSAKLSELLLPIIDNLPCGDELPGFRQVLQEIDHYLATRPLSSARPVSQVTTAEVSEAAWVLSGHRVVLIGGTRRP